MSNAHLNLFVCRLCGRKNDVMGTRHGQITKGVRTLRSRCKRENCPCDPQYLTGMAAIAARTADRIVKGLPTGLLDNLGREIKLTGGIRRGEQS